MDAFTDFQKRLLMGTEIENDKAYITSAVLNNCCSHLRWRDYRNSLLELLKNLVPVAAAREFYPPINLRRSPQEALELCMRRLPDKHHAVMHWRLAEGLSQKEIGQRLGVHQTTVGRLLGEALQMIWEMPEMEEYWHAD